MSVAVTMNSGNAPRRAYHSATNSRLNTRARSTVCSRGQNRGSVRSPFGPVLASSRSSGMSLKRLPPNSRNKNRARTTRTTRAPNPRTEKCRAYCARKPGSPGRRKAVPSNPEAKNRKTNKIGVDEQEQQQKKDAEGQPSLAGAMLSTRARSARSACRLPSATLCRRGRDTTRPMRYSSETVASSPGLHRVAGFVLPSDSTKTP